MQTSNFEMGYMLDLMKSAADNFYGAPKEKKDKLLSYISKELKYLVEKEFAENTPLAQEILHYLKIYKVDLETFISRLSDYTTFHSEAGSSNKMYEDVLIRIIMHFHFYWPGSYHRVRGIVPKEWIKQYRPKTLIDVGYSSPADYVLDKEILANTRISLSDYNANAHDFSKKIFNYHGIDCEQVGFVTEDMNKFKYVGDYETYLFMDSIEHTLNPDKYLQVQVSHAKPGAMFILSIPICPIHSLKNIHHKQWLTEQEAENWLVENGLTIMKKELAVPNIFIDRFATLMHGGYYNALYLCKKIISK